MTDEKLIQELEDIEALYVQTELSAEHAGDRVILKNVAPATLYFSDRPQRVTGHIETSDFVGIWGEGDDSFEANPPNAVLAFLADGSEVRADVVLELRVPILEGADLSKRSRFWTGWCLNAPTDARCSSIPSVGR